MSNVKTATQDPNQLGHSATSLPPNAYRQNLLETFTQQTQFESPDNLINLLALLNGHPTMAIRNATYNTFQLPLNNIPSSMTNFHEKHHNERNNSHQFQTDTSTSNNLNHFIMSNDSNSIIQFCNNQPLDIAQIYLQLLRLQAVSDQKYQPIDLLNEKNEKNSNNNSSKKNKKNNTLQQTTAAVPSLRSTNIDQSYHFDTVAPIGLQQQHHHQHQQEQQYISSTPLFEDFYNDIDDFTSHSQQSNTINASLANLPLNFTHTNLPKNKTSPPKAKAKATTSSTTHISPLPPNTATKLPDGDPQVTTHSILSTFSLKQIQIYEHYLENDNLGFLRDDNIGVHIHSLNSIPSIALKQHSASSNSSSTNGTHLHLGLNEKYFHILQKETQMRLFFDKYGTYLDDNGNFIELPPFQSHVPLTYRNVPGVYTMKNLIETKNRPDEAFCRRFAPYNVVDDDIDIDIDLINNQKAPNDNNNDNDGNNEALTTSYLKDDVTNTSNELTPTNTNTNNRQKQLHSHYSTTSFSLGSCNVVSNPPSSAPLNLNMNRKISSQLHNSNVPGDNISHSSMNISSRGSVDNNGTQGQIGQIGKTTAQATGDETDRQAKLQKNVDKLLTTAQEQYQDNSVDFRDKIHHDFLLYTPSLGEKRAQQDQQALFRTYTILFFVALSILFVLFCLYIFMSSFSLLCLVSVVYGNHSSNSNNPTDFACFTNSTSTIIVLMVLGLLPFLFVSIIFCTNLCNLVLFKLGFRQPLNDLHF